MRPFTSVGPLLFFLCGAPSAFAGSGTVTGREPGLWDAGGNSVIIALVKEVRVISEPDSGTHEVKLEPIATLAGRLDPSEIPLLTVRLYAHRPETSSIADAPPIGSFVLAVVGHGFLKGDPDRPCAFVESMWCKFMPGDAGLVVVDGLGDKRVIETLIRIRDARAHPDK